MPEEIEPNQTSDERRFRDSDADATRDREFIEQQRIEKALRDARPTFATDGSGLQGPQGFPKRTQDEPRRTDFGQGSVVRHPQASVIHQTVEGETNGEPVDIYGAYNGQPAIFHLLQTAAPTPL